MDTNSMIVNILVNKNIWSLLGLVVLLQTVQSKVQWPWNKPFHIVCHKFAYKFLVYIYEYVYTYIHT